ncbi:putative MFS family arabinose efflux permease [Flavobacteriaceae bacterium MAR_2010_105]|nr:putative MFS family arabinose efflux permease [Flavobacteriaceae bacterium MAR_2010_105]
MIVFSQFCCTSLWFAGNGVMGDLITNFNLNQNSLGHLTSAVQLGFIIGTLTFAILTVSDRFSPSKVFFVSAVLGAICNIGMLLEFNNFMSLMSLRMLTGFFLAGIYPVGMKIAADYYDKGLGKALGYLVGALVIGTAFPHILKGYLHTFSWHHILLITSALAVIGGLMMFILVPDGPYRKQSVTLDVSAFSKVFKNSNFRAAAFGYFGHMWELYAFWAFVPVMLKYYTILHPENHLNIPMLSFFIIAVGGLSCVLGGYISQYIGAKKTAFTALLLSCICCLISPLMFEVNSVSTLIGFLIIWGIVVIADSPMFSTLVAQNADAKIKGTALTIVNCIGFSITIISIQILNTINSFASTKYMYLLLAIGPLLGLLALSKKKS